MTKGVRPYLPHKTAVTVSRSLITFFFDVINDRPDNFRFFLFGLRASIRYELVLDTQPEALIADFRKSRGERHKMKLNVNRRHREVGLKGEEVAKCE